MRTGILIQTRMGSTRLPGKVMKTLLNKPVIEHIIDRLKHVNVSTPPIIMTTQNPNDDILAEFCKTKNINCFRGSENNLMDRTLEAAKFYNLDAFVRLGADAPFIDWKIINHLLDIFEHANGAGNPLDYVSNTMERSFPLGLDAEVMTTALLKIIDKKTLALSPEERLVNEENVIPYLHQNRHLFKTHSYTEKFDYSGLRLTLDTPEDFELTRLLYEALYPDKPDFLMEDILNCLESHPDWMTVNANVIPKTGYWTITEQDKLEEGLSRGQLYGKIKK